jgi:hypothetical protein
VRVWTSDPAIKQADLDAMRELLAKEAEQR